MQAVCFAIETTRQDVHTPNDWRFDVHRAESGDDLTAIGRELFAMNWAAVHARYPSDTKESAPGPCDISDIYGNFKYESPCPRVMPGLLVSNGNVPTRAAQLKACECLRYQCTEGDVPETSLFRALDALCEHIAREIAHATPAYKAAAWG